MEVEVVDIPKSKLQEMKKKADLRRGRKLINDMRQFIQDRSDEVKEALKINAKKKGIQYPEEDANDEILYGHTFGINFFSFIFGTKIINEYKVDEEISCG